MSCVNDFAEFAGCGRKMRSIVYTIEGVFRQKTFYFDSPKIVLTFHNIDDSINKLTAECKNMAEADLRKMKKVVDK